MHLFLGFSTVCVKVMCQTVEDILLCLAQYLSSQKCVCCKCALVGWIFSPFIACLLHRTRYSHYTWLLSLLLSLILTSILSVW